MQLVQSHPTGIKTKDKQHAFNKIGLSRSVGSNDGGKVFVKRSDLLRACIRLEVLQDDMVDDESRLALFNQRYDDKKHIYLVAFWVP